MVSIRIPTGLFLAMLFLVAACDANNGDVRVTRYEGPPLGREDAPLWTVLRNPPADEVRLEFTLTTARGPGRYVVAGLLDGQTVRLTFKAASEEWPRYEDLWVGVPGGLGRVLVDGDIRIQQWDDQGVMSGLIDGTLEGGGIIRIAFWAEGAAGNQP